MIGFFLITGTLPHLLTINTQLVKAGLYSLLCLVLLVLCRLLAAVRLYSYVTLCPGFYRCMPAVVRSCV